MSVIDTLDQWTASFRHVFRRKATFHWFVIVIFAFMLRIEGEGVTSIIRCLGLPPNDYYNLLHFFHSSAFAIEPLCRHWMSLVFQIAPTLSVKDRPVYLFDAIKVGKSGKKMPGVKMLHQESEDNTKAEFIMGHFWGALSLLCGSGQRAFAIPLRLQLQDGLKRSPSEKATLTDKMHKLVIDSGVEAVWTGPCRVDRTVSSFVTFAFHHSIK